MSPQIGYVNVMLLFRSWHLAINSPLGHFNGDNAYSHSPKIPDTQISQWHPKFISSNGNMAFAELQWTQSLTRPMTHAAISTFSTSHNAISSPYSQSYSPWVLQYQKQTQYSMLQIKPISKNTFRLSPSYFINYLHPPFISHSN